MTWDASEEQRILAIEETLNKVQIAISNLASKQQIRQLLLVKQTEIDALLKRVEDLEKIITLLEQSIK